MNGAPWLILRLVVALLAMHGACALLARLLGARLERWIAGVALALPLLYLVPWTFSASVTAPTGVLAGVIPGAGPAKFPEPHAVLSDAVLQLLPWELEVRHALAEHRLPLWSDTLEGGSSPWANPQAAVLSPIAMLARALPLQHHLLAALALKMLVAFEGAWLLARALGRSRTGSLLAALAVALGGAILPWGLFTNSATAAWIPWLVLAYVRLVRRPSARYALAGALVVAILLLSGHPETAAFGALFAGTTALALRRRGRFWAGLGASLAAAVLGFLLVAPLILPFLAQAHESKRATELLQQPTPVSHPRLASPGTWFVPEDRAFLKTALGPSVYNRPYEEPFRGPWDWPDSLSGYAGLLALGGGLVAAIGVRDRRRWPLLLFVVLAWLTAAAFTPIVDALWAVPALRVPAYKRLLLVAALALTMLGAFGIDALLRRKASWRIAAAFALAAVISLWADTTWTTAALWAGATAALLLARRHPRTGRWALAAVLLFDLVPWGWAQIPSGTASLFYPKGEFVERLREVTGDGRAVGGAQLVYPSLLAVYGIEDIRTNNPLASTRHLEVLRNAFGFAPAVLNYYAFFDGLDHPLLDFLDVRAAVWSVALPRPTRLELAYPALGGLMGIYRNPHALPRWFFPTAAPLVADDDLPAWIRDLDDARRVALRADEGTCAADPSGAPPVLLRKASGAVDLAVEPRPAARLLATSILRTGWNARAGGAALPLRTVNDAFLGVCVPAGVERLELRYLPPRFRLGLALMTLALLAATALAWRARPR